MSPRKTNTDITEETMTPEATSDTPEVAMMQAAPITPGRQELKDAVAALETAQSAFTQSEQTLKLARDARQKAQSTVESFTDVDQRIVKYRIDALKRGNDSALLPAELRDSQLEKLRSKEELAHAEEVLKHIEADHESANKALQAARGRHESALAGVFAEHVQEVLKHLAEANQWREHLRILLKGTGVPAFTPGHWQTLHPDQRRSILLVTLRDAGFPFGSPQDWEHLYRLITDAFEGNQAPVLSEYEKKVSAAKAKAYWGNFAKDISASADATPGPLPSWEYLIHVENPATIDIRG